MKHVRPWQKFNAKSLAGRQLGRVRTNAGARRIDSAQLWLDGLLISPARQEYSDDQLHFRRYWCEYEVGRTLGGHRFRPDLSSWVAHCTSLLYEEDSRKISRLWPETLVLYRPPRLGANSGSIYLSFSMHRLPCVAFSPNRGYRYMSISLARYERNDLVIPYNIMSC